MKAMHKRQGFLGPNMDRTLEGARVAVIGLCGGGSHIAQQLAHAGVGGFDLIDFDCADDTNINRMVGLTRKAAEDGLRKVDVIGPLVNAINPQAKVRTHFGTWEDHMDVLKNCSAIFGAVDSYLARDGLERFARRYLIPYIDVGMDVHKTATGYLVAGQMIVSAPDCPCLRCFGFLTDERLAQEAQGYGQAGGSPQVIWTNGVLASSAVASFMQMILPWNSELRTPLYLEYDGNHQSLTPSKKLAYVPIACPHFEGSSIGDYQAM